MKKPINWILVALTIILFGVGISLFIQKRQDISLFFQFLSGFSTFIVAILTTLYVYTTNRQLNTMEKQLVEMHKSRELSDQPFPWIDSLLFVITKPKFFYTPPINRASIHCLYAVKFKVKNIGRGTAIGVFIDPSFNAKHKNETFSTIELYKELEIIEEGAYFEANRPSFDNPNEIWITDDLNFVTLKSLLTRNFDEFPTLSVTILYRNFLGASFKINCKYQVIPSIDRIQYFDKIKHLNDWLTILMDAQIKYATELKQIEAAGNLEDHSTCRDKVNTLAKEFNQVFHEVREEDLELPIVFVPSDFKVVTISQEEYESLTNQLLSEEEKRRYE